MDNVFNFCTRIWGIIKTGYPLILESIFEVTLGDVLDVDIALLPGWAQTIVGFTAGELILGVGLPIAIAWSIAVWIGNIIT